MKKSKVSVTDSMRFSSDSLSQSPATNFTGQTADRDQRRSAVPSRSCCTMSMLRLSLASVGPTPLEVETASWNQLCSGKSPNLHGNTVVS